MYGNNLAFNMFQLISFTEFKYYDKFFFYFEVDDVNSFVIYLHHASSPSEEKYEPVWLAPNVSSHGTFLCVCVEERETK